MFFNIHNALSRERTITLMLKHQMYRVYTNVQVYTNIPVHTNNSKHIWQRYTVKLLYSIQVDIVDKLTFRSEEILQAHTVVWECCKDDRQSQWEMAKIDPQPTLNPWTDRHQIWNTWLGRGHILPKKFRGQSTQGFLPPHARNHPKPSNVYFTFFSSSEPQQTSLLDRFSRLIRHTTWFCAMYCLLGVRKFKFKI